MQALYRKYRSKSLAEVVGQQHITTALTNAIAKGSINHAYLFTGPRGVGKTSVARIFAHAINQLPYTDESTHLDIIEVDAASNRRIDDIRDLREKVHIAPVAAPYKVYIIDEVHMLTLESFNALLKTLEEPPAHVIFILATTEVHKLPATIISRVQRFSFQPVSQELVAGHLASIAQAEGIAIEPEALQRIALQGEGSFRDSIGLLDQLRNADTPITVEVVERQLGLAPQPLVEALLQALMQGDIAATQQQLLLLTATSTTIATIVPQLLQTLRQQALSHPQLYILADRLLEVPRAYNPEIKLLTTIMSYALERKSEPSAMQEVPIAQLPAEHSAPLQLEPPVITQTVEQELPEPPASLQVSAADLTPELWATVLEQLRIHSPPLYGILKQTPWMYDLPNRQLTLTAKYALHSKRLEETKAKQLLGQLVGEAVGDVPTIVVIVGAGGHMKESSQLDPAAQAVAEIMGGGEPVDV